MGPRELREAAARRRAAATIVRTPRTYPKGDFWEDDPASFGEVNLSREVGGVLWVAFCCGGVLGSRARAQS